MQLLDLIHPPTQGMWNLATSMCKFITLAHRRVAAGAHGFHLHADAQRPDGRGCARPARADPAARPAAHRVQGRWRLAGRAARARRRQSPRPAPSPTWRSSRPRPRPASHRRSSRASSASTGCSAARSSTRSLALLDGGEHRLLSVSREARRPSDEARRHSRRGRGAIAATFAARAAPGAISSPTARRKPIRSSWCAPPAAALARTSSLIVAGRRHLVRPDPRDRQAGADAFTIGTAVFDGSYSPSKGSILSQLSDVARRLRASLSGRGSRRDRHRDAEPEGGRRRRRPEAARRRERSPTSRAFRARAGPSRTPRSGSPRCGRRSRRALEARG